MQGPPAVLEFGRDPYLRGCTAIEGSAGGPQYHSDCTGHGLECAWPLKSQVGLRRAQAAARASGSSTASSAAAVPILFARIGGAKAIAIGLSNCASTRSRRSCWEPRVEGSQGGKCRGRVRAQALSASGRFSLALPRRSPYTPPPSGTQPFPNAGPGGSKVLVDSRVGRE